MFSGIAFMVLAAAALLLFVSSYQKRLLQQQLRLRTTEASHQQQIMAAIIEAQEGERERIGQDLHDGIGSTVATAKLLINRLSSMPNVPPPPDLLAIIEELMTAAVADVRTISHSLYPAVLSRYGLVDALQYLVDVSNETGKLPIKLEIGYFQPLAHTQELALYRICQELIHNALKHAKGATQLLVLLRQHGTGLTLEVVDDGCGFAVATPATGRNGAGLRSIEVRVQMLQATFQCHSVPDQGTRMIIELPAAA